METAEQIAARYGAELSPGVEVQRIPFGETSFVHPVWDERTQSLKLRETREEYLSRVKASTWRGSTGARAAAAARKAQSERIADAIRAAHASGATVAQIAEGLDRSSDTIARRLREMGLTPNERQPYTFDRPELVAEVKRLYRAGYSRAHVARETQISERSVQRIVDVHGIKRGKLRVVKSKRSKAPATTPIELVRQQAREAASAAVEMRKQGAEIAEIAAAVGRSISAVKRYVEGVPKGVSK